MKKIEMGKRYKVIDIRTGQLVKQYGYAIRLYDIAAHERCAIDAAVAAQQAEIDRLTRERDELRAMLQHEVDCLEGAKAEIDRLRKHAT